MRGKSFGLRDGKLIIKQQLTCAGLQFPELSHRSSGVYCAQEFNFFSLGIGNYDLKNGGRGIHAGSG